MKKFSKKWIKMNEDSKEEVSENIEEKKEENEMGFFAKHKKGLIIGGLGALAAGAVGLIIANKGSDDADEDFVEFDDIDSDDEEATSEEASEA